jgi:hypothetical protein
MKIPCCKCICLPICIHKVKFEKKDAFYEPTNIAMTIYRTSCEKLSKYVTPPIGNKLSLLKKFFLLKKGIKYESSM